MQKPMKLPCCGQHLDKESIKALLVRLALDKTELQCPLCRKNWTLISSKEAREINKAIVSSRKVEGIILNSNFKKEIDLWIAKSPKERNKLACKTADFPDPPSTSQRPFIQVHRENLIRPTPPPEGLMEALLQSHRPASFYRRESFGVNMRFEPENSSPEAKKIRDFLVTFNTIWVEIPVEIRPKLRADSQKRLFELAVEWMRKEESGVALSKVIILNLPGLNLASFPNELLSKLSFLEALDASGNALSEIPVVPSLCWLNLRNNRIRRIESNITKMIKLKVLYLGKNPIEFVSEKIAKMKTLKVLEVKTFSSKFKGFDIGFTEFFGEIACPKEYLCKFASKVKALTEEIIEMEKRIRKDGKKIKAAILRKMPPFSKARIETLQKLLSCSTNKKKGLSKEKDFPLEGSTFLLTAVSYIAWLYFHHLNDVAESLFLKLPKKFRDEVYAFVYKKSLPQLDEQGLRDVEYGKNAFLNNGCKIDDRLRFRSLVAVGDRFKKRAQRACR